MMNKPQACCPPGSYEHEIMLPISGRVRGVDFCVARVVAALNAANIPTISSCCGHGVSPAIISYDDFGVDKHAIIFDSTITKEKLMEMADYCYELAIKGVKND